MTEFPLHSRVALKDGMDKVYSFAVAGSEGWVRDKKLDPDGFPLVKIEWDKNHWRYNGQPDGWTFQDHFSILEEPQEQPEEEDAPPEELLAHIIPERDWDAVEGFIEDLTEAMDAASESEGFFMIVVRRRDDPEKGQTMYFPSIYDNALSEEARCLLDAQLSECASQNYQFMIANMMEILKRKE